MDNNTFSNETILAWLNFFSNGTLIDLEHVKILDITRKNKNGLTKAMSPLAKSITKRFPI